MAVSVSSSRVPHTGIPITSIGIIRPFVGPSLKFLDKAGDMKMLTY